MPLLYDADVTARAATTFSYSEQLRSAPVYGIKLSPDGSMLFQPTINGIDVYDANRGNLAACISLSIALSPVFDALFSDGRDNVLVAITGTACDALRSSISPLCRNLRRFHLQRGR